MLIGSRRKMADFGQKRPLPGRKYLARRGHVHAGRQLAVRAAATRMPNKGSYRGKACLRT